MSPFTFVALCSVFGLGALCYIFLRLIDRVPAKRWSSEKARLVVLCCPFFLGIIPGGVFGFWFMYIYFINFTMYAPLEGSIYGAFWGGSTSLLISGLYAGHARLRK